MLECTSRVPPWRRILPAPYLPGARRVGSGGPGEPLFEHRQQCNRGRVGLVEDREVAAQHVAVGDRAEDARQWRRALGPDGRAVRGALAKELVDNAVAFGDLARLVGITKLDDVE